MTSTAIDTALLLMRNALENDSNSGQNNERDGKSSANSNIDHYVKLFEDVERLVKSNPMNFQQRKELKEMVLQLVGLYPTINCDSLLRRFNFEYLPISECGSDYYNSRLDSYCNSIFATTARSDNIVSQIQGKKEGTNSTDSHN